MWVVKLGGSLADSIELLDWLETLSGSPVVIVAGGGPFAEQVRAAQCRWDFDDSSAHHMALLAMEQYGRMLCALQPGLLPAATLGEIRSVVARGAAAVWMPVDMVLEESTIPHSWDVTSDSLAAWLCRQLDAEGLLMVKSISGYAGVQQLDALTENAIVDAAFREHILESDTPLWLATRQDSLIFKRALTGDMSGMKRVATQRALSQ